MIKFRGIDGLIDYSSRLLTKEECAKKALGVGLAVGERMKSASKVTIDELQEIVNNQLCEHSVFVTDSRAVAKGLLDEIGNNANDVILNPNIATAATLPGKGGNFICLPSLADTENSANYVQRAASASFLTHELNHALVANHTEGGRAEQKYLNSIALDEYKKVLVDNNAHNLVENAANLQNGILRKFLIREQQQIAKMQGSSCMPSCKILQTVNEGFTNKLNKFYSRLDTKEAFDAEVKAVAQEVIPKFDSLNKDEFIYLSHKIAEESDCYRLQANVEKRLMNLPSETFILWDFTSVMLGKLSNFLGQVINLS